MCSKFLDTLKIYVDIVNHKVDQSDLFDEIIPKFGGKIEKALNKKIDYIIFKDGKEKTLKYSLENKIKVVNPLWLDDKINGKFFPVNKYLVDTGTLTEIDLRDQIKKEKAKLLGNKTKRQPKNSKLKSQTLKENADNNLKITSFFRKVIKEK